MKEEEIIFIASDHAGFELKEKLKKFLKKLKINYKDLGSSKFKKTDDYPDYAFKLGEQVVRNKSRGILICGSGVGVCIAANKVKGIRAVAVYDPMIAVLSREHNATNVLCLQGSGFNFKKTQEIVALWLETPFSEEERHKRRIYKILAYEK